MLSVLEETVTTKRASSVQSFLDTTYLIFPGVHGSIVITKTEASDVYQQEEHSYFSKGAVVYSGRMLLLDIFL